MYAWMLCVFTVIMAYSITCPIIAPFGEWPWSLSRVGGFCQAPQDSHHWGIMEPHKQRMSWGQR